MRDRWWVRLSSPALVVAFLLAALGEVLPGHACPHHDGMAVGHAEAEVAAIAAPAHGATAPEPEDGSDPGHHGPCTCVGACHAGAATPLTAGLLAHRIPLPPSVRDDASSRPSDAPARRPLRYRLHQPNAPPVAA